MVSSARSFTISGYYIMNGYSEIKKLWFLAELSGGIPVLFGEIFGGIYELSIDDGKYRLAQIYDVNNRCRVIDKCTYHRAIDSGLSEFDKIYVDEVSIKSAMELYYDKKFSIEEYRAGAGNMERGGYRIIVLDRVI